MRLKEEGPEMRETAIDEKEDLEELGGRMHVLEGRLDEIRRRAVERHSNDVSRDARLREHLDDGYDPEAALEALQMVASSVIAEEVPDDRLRLALNELATRFEALDDWMTCGGEIPPQWKRWRR